MQNPVLAAVDQSQEEGEKPTEDGKKEEDPFEEYSEKYLVPKTLKQFYTTVPCKRRLASLALFLRTISMEEK